MLLTRLIPIYMENKQKIILAVGAGVIIVLCALVWWKIFTNNTVPKDAPAGAPTATQPAVPSVAVDPSPIQRPEPPKLAGSVLTAAGLKTKFYLARDGKRYVFPDETKTFETWYPAGTKAPLVSLTREELEKYPLGGNVWYRPGTRLIRISTDDRIFAVAHGGVLRPINAGNAETIFGANWKSRVDMLQDYYFTNYTVGTQISSLVDYNPEMEQGRSATIDADKGIN